MDTMSDKLRARLDKPGVIQRRVFTFRNEESEAGANPPADPESGDVEEGEERLRGMAVPFDTETRIDDPWDGPFDEQFARGAFEESLQNMRVSLLLEHGYNMLADRTPFGVFESIEETERGLEFVANPFRNWLTEPTLDAVRAGVVDQMSIGFHAQDYDIVEREEDEQDIPLVTHNRAELPEMSIVLWAAYPTTELELKTSQARRNSPNSMLALPARGRNQPGNTNKPRPRLARAKAILTLERIS